MQERLDFNGGWKFHFGDYVSVRNRWAWGKSGSFNQGPESRTFADGDWREVSLPHDFVFETKVYDYSEKEFDGDNVIPAMEDVNNIHTTAGSFDKNVGWYRKHFYLPKAYEGKRLLLVFEGIYRDSSIFLNDFFLQREPDGYSRITVDITDCAAYGEENVLAVRCDAREAEGWFYEGGGIYRKAYLQVTEPEYLEDIFVHGEPDLESGSADITVSARVAGAAGAQPEAAVFAADGREVLRLQLTAESGSGDCREVQFRGRLSGARLWSPEDTYRYRLVCRLSAEGEVKYEEALSFGIRKAVFDAEKGFLLNGKQVKIKGVCCHQNHGGLGSAVPEEVFRYRIRKLKEMGANGYRCSHYPPAESLLSICDEEGMLVLDETRLLSGAAQDMAVLERMVKMGRNHPSVILYSIGNEEAQSQATPQGARIAKTMIAAIRKLDPHTPVTMALLMWDLKNRKPYTDTEILAGISEQLDVAGFNYQDARWEAFHKRYPEQPFLCTEQGTFKSTRGCYETVREKCHLAITDKSADSYMAGARQWQVCLPDWVSGLFIWTGFDYYGEPTPFAWPAISSQFGAMDLCGYPKDFYYFYKAWWSGEKVLHVFPDGNLPEGTRTDYHVFSNAEEVELVQNGSSLGRKRMENGGYLVWENVTAERGGLLAVGYRDGREIMRSSLKTAGKERRLQITEEYRENDIVIRRLAVTDEAGNVVPGDDREFVIPAEWGTLLGASNGDPSDHTPGKCGRVRTFHGLAQVIVKEKDRR